MPSVSSGIAGNGPLAQRLLRTLSATKSRYDGKEEDMTFLMTMVQSSDFQALMGVQQTLAQKKQRAAEMAEEDLASPEPVTSNSGTLLSEVCDMIFHSGVRRNSREAKLLTILSSPHFHGVMSAHDRVANGEFSSSTDWKTMVTATVGESSNNSAGTDERDGGPRGTKTVRLLKSGDQPLGATIKIRQPDRAVVIGRVLHGSLAHQSGMLLSGDEVLAINGRPVAGLSIDSVVDIVKAARDHIDFSVKSSDDDSTATHAATECHMTVRTQFMYDPSKDRMNPCKEAGLAFAHGELLTVVSQADPRWWQARRMDSKGNVLAGLIPGPLERQRREALRQRKDSSQKPPSYGMRKLSLGGGRKKSKGYTATGLEDPDAVVEFASYEEVARMLPKQREPRPLVLIGAAGVGCTEVQEQLVRSHRHLYSRARPTSTMLMRGSASSQFEQVSAREMLDRIAENRFVEYSRVGNHWYGTTLASIQRVQRAGRTCVMHVPPKTLRTLRIADIKPFVVFLAPPDLDRLRAKLRHRDSHSIVRSHRLDEELSAMCTASSKMEKIYGHYFDLRLVHEDIDATVTRIDESMERVRTEENWVPAEWVRGVEDLDDTFVE